jgi:hypothetical protein
VEIKFVDDEVVYDGKAHSLKGLEVGDSLDRDEYELFYKSHPDPDIVGTEVDLTTFDRTTFSSETNVNFINDKIEVYYIMPDMAGIGVRRKSDNNDGPDVSTDYYFGTDPGRLTILPRPVTITVDATKVYGEDDPDYDVEDIERDEDDPDTESGVVAKDLVGGEALPALTGLKIERSEVGEGVKVDDPETTDLDESNYALTATTENNNYEVIVKGGLKITPRPVEVDVKLTAVYGKTADLLYDPDDPDDDEYDPEKPGKLKFDLAYLLDPDGDPATDDALITAEPYVTDPPSGLAYDDDIGDLELTIEHDEMKWDVKRKDNGELDGYELKVTSKNPNYDVTATGTLTITPASADDLEDKITVAVTDYVRADEDVNGDDVIDEKDIAVIPGSVRGGHGTDGEVVLEQVYDGEEHGIAVLLDGINGKIFYNEIADNWDEEDDEYDDEYPPTDISPTVTNVKMGVIDDQNVPVTALRIYYRITHPNYEPAEGVADLIITPRPVKITLTAMKLSTEDDSKAAVRFEAGKALLAPDSDPEDPDSVDPNSGLIDKDKDKIEVLGEIDWKRDDPTQNEPGRCYEDVGINSVGNTNYKVGYGSGGTLEIIAPAELTKTAIRVSAPIKKRFTLPFSATSEAFSFISEAPESVLKLTKEGTGADAKITGIGYVKGSWLVKVYRTGIDFDEFPEFKQEIVIIVNIN